MSSSLFSVIFAWFSKLLLFLFATTINSQNLCATLLIYVPGLRSNYKHHLEFPFNKDNHRQICVQIYILMLWILVSVALKMWFICLFWRSVYLYACLWWQISVCFSVHPPPPPKRKKKKPTHTHFDIQEMDRWLHLNKTWNLVIMRTFGTWKLPCYIGISLFFIGGANEELGPAKSPYYEKGCYMRPLYRDVRVQILIWF